MPSEQEVYDAFKRANPEASDAALAEGVMRYFAEQPGESAQGPSGFRNKFRTVMDQVAAAPEWVGQQVAKVTRPTMTFESPEAEAQYNRTLEEKGTGLGNLVPRTPEGMALLGVPFIRGLGGPTKAGTTGLLETGPRAMGGYPLIGGAITGVTGGSGDEIAQGGLQGLLQGATVAGGRALGHLGRRLTGTEPSLRNVAKITGQEVALADDVAGALAQDARIPLTGRGGTSRLVGAPKTIQDAISTDYDAVQRTIEGTFRGRTLTLPTLAEIRGKYITTPAVPGRPAAPVLGPQGQMVAGQATPGTPARQVLDTSFTPKEAFEAIKDFGSYSRKASYTATGQPKGGEPLTGAALRRQNRAAREELTQEITRQGSPDLAAEFDRTSAFYARGLDHMDLAQHLAKSGAFREAGSTTGGGLNPVKAREAYMEWLAKNEFNELSFPSVSRVLFRGQPLGARDVTRPGMSTAAGGGQGRVYGPGMGVGISVPGTQVPIGTPLQVGGGLSQVAGAGTTLGVENLVKDLPEPAPLRPRRKPTVKDALGAVPLLAPSVGVE